MSMNFESISKDSYVQLPSAEEYATFLEWQHITYNLLVIKVADGELYIDLLVTVIE